MHESWDKLKTNFISIGFSEPVSEKIVSKIYSTVKEGYNSLPVVNKADFNDRNNQEIRRFKHKSDVFNIPVGFSVLLLLGKNNRLEINILASKVKKI